MAVWLMSELRKKVDDPNKPSFWQPYFDILPKDDD